MISFSSSESSSISQLATCSAEIPYFAIIALTSSLPLYILNSMSHAFILAFSFPQASNTSASALETQYFSKSQSNTSLSEIP
jgi:hypothetical protein